MGITDSSKKYIKFSVYLVALVLLNVAGLTLFFRVDLTAGKLFSISDVSRQVVSTLSEPLTINVFFTRNLPAPHNNTERYLNDLLAEYADSANRYFNYRFYDVSPDEGDLRPATRENQKLARNYGINPIQIQVVEKDEVKFQKAYMGLVIIHGDQIERIPTITATDGLEYKMTMAIRNLNNKVSALLALEDKIQVKLFLSAALKHVAPLMRLEKLSQIPDRMEQIVKELNDKSYGKIEFQYLDPTADAELEQEIDRYDILRLNWPDIDNGRIKAGTGAIGLVVEYADKSVVIPMIKMTKIPGIGTQYQLANLDKMKEIISASMESLIDINQNMGVLADFGSLPVTAPAPPDPMGPRQAAANNFRAQANRNYSLKAVKLKAGDVLDGFNCLVIPGPKEKFSDYDLFQIDQFLMQGKSLAIFINPLLEVIPKNQQFMQAGVNYGYLPLESGLERLLAHYGIEVKTSIVMDENCYKQRLPREMGGGERPIYYVPLIKNANINHDFEFMDNIKGLVAVKASPMMLDVEKIKSNGLTARPLFSSSDRSWEMKDRINFDPRYIRLPGPEVERKNYTLAYMIEGEFPSYFAGKPVPEKTEDKKENPGLKKEEENEKVVDGGKDENLAKIEGHGKIIEKGKPGKLFVLASTEMITDSIMDKGGRTSNDIMIMNVLDFLNDQPEIARMRSKQQSLNPLYKLGAQVKTFVKTANIAGLPVLVVIFGLLVWLWRRSRKKRIQMMFMEKD